jgi:choice-of-anchor B domain-containing protein
MLSLLIAVDAKSQQAQSRNTRLYAHWQNTEPTYWGIWSDLTGWQNPVTGTEYIISGTQDSIYFLEIGSDTLYKRTTMSGKGISGWRDFESYSHYVYCVAGNFFNKNKLQIFDLNYLPDSVVQVFSSDTFFKLAHTIYIDSASKRLYVLGSYDLVSDSSAPLIILSLENPEKPTVLARINGPLKSICRTIHEAFARNDTLYCSCSNDGLQILDVANPLAPKIIGSITPPYPFNGYNHSGCLDPSGKYLIFSDEVPSGLPIKLYDVSNPRHPDFITTFSNHRSRATPHNTYWVGNLLYVSYYYDGVVVFDMTDPLNLVPFAWYDTHLQTPSNPDNFEGCWGVFPFFKSGKIAATDMQNGIFVFELDTPATVTTGLTLTESPDKMISYPNPFESSIIITGLASGTHTVQLLSITGSLLKEAHVADDQKEIFFNDLEHLHSGIYVIQIDGTGFRNHRKMIKM